MLVYMRLIDLNTGLMFTRFLMTQMQGKQLFRYWRGYSSFNNIIMNYNSSSVNLYRDENNGI